MNCRVCGGPLLGRHEEYVCMHIDERVCLRSAYDNVRNERGQNISYLRHVAETKQPDAVAALNAFEFPFVAADIVVHAPPPPPNKS